MTAIGSRGQVVTIDEGPGVFDVASAAFERVNIFGSAVARAGISPDSFFRQFQRPDEVKAITDGWDGIKQTIGTSWEPFLNRLGPTRSPEEYALEQVLILREIEQDRILRQAGGAGIAAMFSLGLIDPLMFAPAAAGAKGLSLARRFAIAGGLAGIAQETLLQTIDPDRTAKESLVTIGTMSLIGGILGKGVSLVGGRTAMRKISDDVDELIRTDFAPTPIPKSTSVSSGTADRPSGMAEVKSWGSWEEDIAGRGPGGEVLEARPEPILKGKVAPLGVENALGRLTITGQMMTSPSAPTRLVAERLIRGSMFTEGNVTGRVTAQGAETEIDIISARALGEILEAGDEVYFAYRKGFAGATRRSLMALGASDLAESATREAKNLLRGSADGISIEDIRAAAAGIGKPEGGWLSRREFDDAVAFASANGGVHDNPFVARMAKIRKDKLFDPLYERAVASGVVSAETNVLNKSRGYLNRIYLMEKIQAEPENFQALVARSFARDQDINAAKFAGVEGEEFVKLTPKQIKTLSEDVWKHMVNAPMARTMGDTLKDMSPTVRGSLANRTLDFIDDVDLLNGAWLDTGFESGARRYIRSVVPDTILKERFGTIGLDAQLKDIEADYAGRIANRRNDNPKRPKETDADYDNRMGRYVGQMNRRLKKDIDNIELTVSMMRGAHVASSNPQHPAVRTLRSMRGLQVLTKGGGFLVASFPDIARPAMVHGVRQAYGTAFNLLRNGMKGLKLSESDARIMGVHFELNNNTRSRVMSEMVDEYPKGNIVERGIQNATNSFFLLNGLAFWNHAMKTWTSGVTSSVMLNATAELATNGATSAKNMRTLRHLGVTPEMSARIAAQFKQFGATESGVKIAQMSLWKDAEAVRVFSSAIKKDVDNVITTPGITDKPTWLTTEMGMTVGQFKGFSFASSNSVLLSNLQTASKDTLQGIGLALFLGAGVYTMKQKLGGRELGSINDYIWNSIDRSGLLGAMADIHNTFEKFTGYGISRLLGANEAQRYGQFGVVGLAGPSVGYVVDATKALAAPFSTGVRAGRISESEARATLRLMPYRNLFYFQNITNKLAEFYAR